MKQDAFEAFYAPVPVPIQGLTAESRDASRTGAEAAEQVRSRNIAIIRALWQEPRTLNEVAAMTGLPLGSVCSLKHGIERDLVFDSWQTVTRPDGRTTKRTRWRLR